MSGPITLRISSRCRCRILAPALYELGGLFCSMFFRINPSILLMSACLTGLICSRAFLRESTGLLRSRLTALWLSMTQFRTATMDCSHGNGSWTILIT